MNVCVMSVKAVCLVFFLFCGEYFTNNPALIDAYSNGQNIPCKALSAATFHQVSSGGLTGNTLIYVDGYLRKPNATVSIKPKTNVKIALRNTQAIGLLIHIQSNAGNVLTKRLTTTSRYMTPMVCNETKTAAALIHTSIEPKLRETAMLNVSNLTGSITVSISVLVDFSTWYFDKIKLKIVP